MTGWPSCKPALYGTLAVVVLGAAPPNADPLGLVDYDAVIAAEAANAVETPSGTRTITLPGGVELAIDAEDQLLAATDWDGALGCLTTILVDLHAIAQTCPGAITPFQADGIDSAIAALIPVYAAGVLPEAVETDTVADRFEAAVRHRAAEGAAICNWSATAATIAQHFSTEAGRAELAETLAEPRLPVINPCL